MEKLEKQRLYRISNGNACTKKYEKTKKGFLVRMYRNMKSRIVGIQYKKAHLYLGKELLDKEIFYNIALNDENFNKLFQEWELSGYNRKLTPSVDRIDSSLGYSVENIRFITHSENSRLGNVSRYTNGNHKQHTY
jgi:hypothetical protein